MPAREDVAGVVIAVVLGLSLAAAVVVGFCGSRGVVQETQALSSALFRTRQAWHSHESAALGKSEARDGAVVEAVDEGAAGLAVSVSLAEASTIRWAFSNASLNDRAWKNKNCHQKLCLILPLIIYHIFKAYKKT